MPEPLRNDDPRRLGDYELVARLSETPQSVKYEARDAEGTRVSVELLRMRFGLDDEEARDRFVWEAREALSGAEFCTEPVLDVDTLWGRPYIVREIVEGRTLQEEVARNGPRPYEQVRALALGMATALAAVHEAGVVHGDVNPANVLLTPEGPLLLNVGIGPVLDAVALPPSGGGASYRAPGQGMGAAVDVFGWAVTLLFAATGRVSGRPDVSVLSPSLRGVVAACLDREPARRPAARQVVPALLR